VRKILLEASLKIVHSVVMLEEYDETKREENEKGKPKQSAHQSHVENGNLGEVRGQ
jgi:hypothetical protein